MLKWWFMIWEVNKLVANVNRAKFVRIKMEKNPKTQFENVSCKAMKKPDKQQQINSFCTQNL